jgi:hypothetical protein
LFLRIPTEKQRIDGQLFLRSYLAHRDPPPPALLQTVQPYHSAAPKTRIGQTAAHVEVSAGSYVINQFFFSVAVEYERDLFCSRFRASRTRLRTLAHSSGVRSSFTSISIPSIPASSRAAKSLTASFL